MNSQNIVIFLYYEFNFSGLSQEYVTNLFVIELLTSTLSLSKGGSILYKEFSADDLMNGVRAIYDYETKFGETSASLDNTAKVSISFNQPCKWSIMQIICNFLATPVDLELMVTPVFTYKFNNGAIGESLETLEKEFTKSHNIETKTKYIGTVKSNSIITTYLTRGLYLLKALINDKDGNEIEVYRDTIYVTMDGQMHTMLIDR